MSAENENRIDVSFDNGSANITIIETKNGTQISIPIPINDHTNLDYNAGVLTTELSGVTNLIHIQRYMMLRTICDIRKDAINATIAVNNSGGQLDVILTAIFKNETLVKEATLPKLEEIKAVSNDNCKEYISGRVFIKSAYTDHIPIPVTHVFNESGAKPDTFSPEGATIMSSFASVADPATRTDPTKSFPELGLRLQFDRSFMELVGFLEGTTWGATQTSVFDINNSNNTEYSFSINVGNDGGIVSGNNVKNSSIATTPFNGRTGYYFQGNPTKNKFINNNPSPNGDKRAEILKYMIIKEMGDMMQVYVMLVWFCLEQQKNQSLEQQKNQMTKYKFVMSTTDLVVMNTCQLFQMPCLYTNQGKNNSMLTEKDKTELETIFQQKITEKANGAVVYNNWKKNNKFANTLYYLPMTEDGLDKLNRRLNTIYHVINSQNEKQLAIFIMASKNIDKLRYIKMGRSGPLMTSFSNPDIITSVIAKIIENISNINHNLLVDYDKFCNELNNYSDDTASVFKKFIDDVDIEWKQCFSLNILITRQIYPPNSHSYVYVIQNDTHYTKKYRICNGKLVDMILTMIFNPDVDISSFNTIRRDVADPVLTLTTTKPKVSGPGPNENWLIYSIAYWFNGVLDRLNGMFGPTMFGPIFQPFKFLDKIEEINWMGIGGTNHKYNDTTNGNNSLQQPYINIGFVTMIPSIYEKLCNIYEKDDVVYDDDFGEYFIVEFILNLTRYYQGSDTNGNPTGDPMLPPFNNIGPDNFGGSNPPDGSNPPPTSSLQPYEKYVIHTDDIDFDIKNILESDTDNTFKEEFIEDLTHRMNQRISENNRNNNVFTLNDNFARVLIIASGLTFNDDDNEKFSELFSVEGIGAAQEMGVDNHATTTLSPDGAEGTAEGVSEPSTPINSKQDLQTFITPEYSLKNQKFFNLIISPLKDKQISEYLQYVTYDNIYSYSEQLYDTLNNIRDGNIVVGDEKLKQTISEFMNSGKITLEDRVPFNGYEEEDNGTSGGKIIKNKKTRRRMGRTRHKKHHKTIKKHKKHQTSGKNKTRKSKKAKRKNKTR